MSTLTYNVGDYAFWKYDLYPHMLGGVIERVEPGPLPAGGHRVWVQGYGGYFFCPFATLPPAEGKALKAELERLRAERRATEDVIERGYLAKLKGVLRSAGVEHPNAVKWRITPKA